MPTGHGSRGHGHRRSQVKESVTPARRNGTTAKEEPKGDTKTNTTVAMDNEQVEVTEKTSVEKKPEVRVNVPVMEVEETEENDNSDHEAEERLREMQERRAAAKRDFRACGVTSQNFNVREFNTNMAEFIRTLEQPRFNMVDSEYPVEELTQVVGLVNKSVADYKVHTTESQYQLESLTDAMSHIRENLHFSVSRHPMDMRTNGEELSQGELDLNARAAQLTAQLAKVNADITEAVKLATEAESAAVKADIAAEKAREETRRVQEEASKKEQAETLKREEQRKKMEETKRKKEEEEKKEREAIQKKEEEWRKKEALMSVKNANVYDAWPEVEFEHTTASGEKELTCVIRGDPAHFTGSDVTCRRAVELERELTLGVSEEVISHVVDVQARQGEETLLKRPVYIAIPHLMTRQSALSREPVVKALMGGHWVDLPTRDITLDSRKDNKFAQAEVTTLTTLVVMSRFKRDYVTMPANRAHKVTSSFDQRITFSTERATFTHTEHFLLEVQPIDSSTMSDFRSREPVAKGLLTSSSIVRTTWETSKFRKPVTVNLSCPPNPTKARKMALARKLKEEKMKNPKPVVVDFEQQEKEADREKKRMQAFMDENGEIIRKPTKWYMGQYANNDDDETDELHFVYFHGGKWSVDPEVTFKQVKIDVVMFQLTEPLEKFIVLRTRTNVEEEEVLAIVASLEQFLSKKFVEAIVRQRSDDPFEVALHVSPVSRAEAVRKSMEAAGYESGPAPSHVITLHEGDMIELGFSGNIECKDQLEEQLIYKTNVPTVTYFRVTEENKFRQKDQDYFSGLIVLSRRYLETTDNRGKRGEEEEQTLELRKERMCALQINIPKYHVEANCEPVRAPLSLRTNEEPVDGDLLVLVADQLGEEWRRVAHYLGVRRARVQAIVRNMHVGDRCERDARHDMLLTWLKAAPKALDKVASLTAALKLSDRYDLAETVQERGRSFWSRRRIPVK